MSLQLDRPLLRRLDRITEYHWLQQIELGRDYTLWEQGTGRLGVVRFDETFVSPFRGRCYTFIGSGRDNQGLIYLREERHYGANGWGLTVTGQFL